MCNVVVGSFHVINLCVSGEVVRVNDLDRVRVWGLSIYTRDDEREKHCSTSVPLTPALQEFRLNVVLLHQVVGDNIPALWRGKCSRQWRIEIVRDAIPQTILQLPSRMGYPNVHEVAAEDGNSLLMKEVKL